jgi:hypothetical protein
MRTTLTIDDELFAKALALALAPPPTLNRHRAAAFKGGALCQGGAAGKFTRSCPTGRRVSSVGGYLTGAGWLQPILFVMTRATALSWRLVY